MSEQIKRASVQQEVNSLNVRVTAIESTNHAHHSEMMRILTDMNVTIKENFKEIRDDIKDLTSKQQVHTAQIASTEKEITRVDGKLSKVMGSIGALFIAIVGGAFTLATKYIVR
jgi:chromosome segregation ATPase